MVQRALVNSRHRLDKTHLYPRSEFETPVFGICRRLIVANESELLVCPNTGNRFIKNKPEQMEVIIKQHLVEVIINRSIPVTVLLDDRMYRRITLLFDNNVEMRRKVMEMGIKSSIKEYLDGIYEHLKNNTVVNDN